MTKIVYLIGAGASANALPLVKSVQTEKKEIPGFPKALNELANIIAGKNDSRLNNIIGGFRWLSIKSKEFDTIDTFAKFCYLMNPDELTKLKDLITLFFFIEERFLKKEDNRYIAFLTTLMEIGRGFPPDIKILNWNYDSQFELAIARFKCRYSFLSYPKNVSEFIQPHDYNVIHLNGIANYKLRSGNLESDANTDQLADFIINYYDVITKNDQMLTFAWEFSKNNIESPNLIKALQNIDNTEYLVIIGYSFPFFNRDVDKEIFHTIFTHGKLKKIFYQDKFRSGDYLQAQFNIPERIEIKTIDKVDQFYVPFEL